MNDRIISFESKESFDKLKKIPLNKKESLIEFYF